MARAIPDRHFAVNRAVLTTTAPPNGDGLALFHVSTGDRLAAFAALCFLTALASRLARLLRCPRWAVALDSVPAVRFGRMARPLAGGSCSSILTRCAKHSTEELSLGASEPGMTGNPKSAL